MISDEKMATSCCEVIDHWQNPFISQDKFIALSSGMVVGDDIVDEITMAETIGKTSLKQFIDDRVINGTTEFHEKIEKKQLKTFDSIGKKKVYKVKDELIPVKANCDTFGRMLVIQRIRGIDLQDVLEYELSSQPLSLSKANGEMQKSDKSRLFEHLAKSLAIIKDCPLDVPSIYDGMVLLQKLPPHLTTFGVVSDYLFSKVTRQPLISLLLIIITAIPSNHLSDYDNQKLERLECKHCKEIKKTCTIQEIPAEFSKQDRSNQIYHQRLVIK